MGHAGRSRVRRSYGVRLVGALPGLQLLFATLVLVTLVFGVLLQPAPVWATALAPQTAEHYRCDGDPLEVWAFNGPVDADAIPNRSAGTSPGAFVVLEWRGLSLQLPRTNNAGAPSYTDGRWWWSPVDPNHPEFRQRRGTVERFSCEPYSQSFQTP